MAFIVSGSAFVGLGAVGIVLPIVPTTPFFLLAAFLFAKSSERLHSRLLGNRLIGAYLRRYYEGRRMTRRDKAITLLLLWGTLLPTIGWIVGSWWLRGGLLAMGIAVSVHIMQLSSTSSAAPQDDQTGSPNKDSSGPRTDRALDSQSIGPQRRRIE